MFKRNGKKNRSARKSMITAGILDSLAGIIWLIIAVMNLKEASLAALILYFGLAGAFLGIGILYLVNAGKLKS